MSRLTDGDVVVIVNGNEVAQLQVAGSRCGFRGNALHGASVTEEDIGEVVDEVIARLVEGSGSLLLSDGHTDGVGETLAEGTSGHLNTRSVEDFRVTGGFAADLLQAV